MSNLNLDTVELITTLRKAPKNGSASSQDYNDSMREILSDLSALTLFINNNLVPLLNKLPSTASDGLQGSTMYASVDATSSQLFYNQETGTPLTVAEVLQKIYLLYNQMSTSISSLNAKVVALQSRLATTSQTDVAKIIQGFSAALRAMDEMVLQTKQQNNSNSELLAKQRFSRVSTGSLGPSASTTVAISWDPPFVTDNYSAVVSLEDPSGKIRIDKWVKSDDGVNPPATPGTKLFVFVTNTDPSNSQEAFVHAGAKED